MLTLIGPCQRAHAAAGFSVGIFLQSAYDTWRAERELANEIIKDGRFKNITSDMRCDALKRHAQPPIPATGLFLSKWLKRGGERSLNRGRALRAVKATFRFFRFQSQTEATREARI